MSRDPNATPPSLTFLLRHLKVLHKKVVLLSVLTEETPHVLVNERIKIKDLQEGMHRITIHYGFMETPNIPMELNMHTLLELKDMDLEKENITYVIGREILIPTERPGMAIWREKLFAAMTQNSKSAVVYYHLPPEKVIEIGYQLDI